MSRCYESSPVRSVQEKVRVGCSPQSPGLAELRCGPWAACADGSGGPTQGFAGERDHCAVEPVSLTRPGGDSDVGDWAGRGSLSPLQLPYMRAWSGARLDGLVQGPSEVLHGPWLGKLEKDQWDSMLNISAPTQPSSGDSSSWIDAQTTVTVSSARPTPSDSTLFQSSRAASLSPPHRVTAAPFNRPLTPQVCLPFWLIATVPHEPSQDDSPSSTPDSCVPAFETDSSGSASAVETKAPTPRPRPHVIIQHSDTLATRSPLPLSPGQNLPRYLNSPCLGSFSDRVSSDILCLPEDASGGLEDLGSLGKGRAQDVGKAACICGFPREYPTTTAETLLVERDDASFSGVGSCDSHQSPLRRQRYLRPTPPFYLSPDRGLQLPLTEEDSVLGSRQSTPQRLSEWALCLSEYSAGLERTPCGEQCLREVDDERDLKGNGTPHVCAHHCPCLRCCVLTSLKLLPRRAVTSGGPSKHDDPNRVEAQPSALHATPESCTGERDVVEGLLSPWEESGGAPTAASVTRRASAATSTLQGEAAVPLSPRPSSPAQHL